MEFILDYEPTFSSSIEDINAIEEEESLNKLRVNIKGEQNIDNIVSLEIVDGLIKIVTSKTREDGVLEVTSKEFNAGGKIAVYILEEEV